MDHQASRYKSFGSGPEKVFVLHNWFCDNSLYAPILPYIDQSRFTLLFMDLRGYGGAKELAGTYSLQEAGEDVLALAKFLQWEQFHIVSHSMSCMIADWLAKEHPSKMKNIVHISPLTALGPSQELLLFLEEAALQGGDRALECLHVLTHRRYSDFVIKKLLDQWHACSHSRARLAYLHMFFHAPKQKKQEDSLIPRLFLLSDEEYHQHPFTIYPNAQVAHCKHAGHFLVQEAPLYLASCITQFLSSKA